MLQNSLRVFDASVEVSLFMCCRLITGTCVAVLLQGFNARAQEAAPDNPTSLTPSWETQRQAATYALAIPAPRGQITDRNGVPLAQTRVSNNLSVVFPTPFDFTDRQIVDFVNRAAALAR